MRGKLIAMLFVATSLSGVGGSADEPEVTSPAEVSNFAGEREHQAAAAQEHLQEFLASQKPGDPASNRDQVIQQAQKIGEQFRKAYPYESLRKRLAYETANDSGQSNPALAPEAAVRLDRHDARFASQSAPGGFGNFRAKSLEKLHSNEVARFVARQGFGLTRMPAPASPRYWKLPPAPTVPFAAAPLATAQSGGAQVKNLPKQVTRFDMARMHAGEPTWTEEQVERNYFDKLPYDKKMLAMHETYSAWKAKHNPLNLPSRGLIFDSHDAAVIDFAGSGRNGYVKDLDHVVGFGSHAMTNTPRFEPGPIELRYWPNTGQENPVDWLVTQLQLVSLLKHADPAVYVSDNLPKMEELQRAPLRPLNDFETASLAQLYQGEHVALEVRAKRIRMLGAVRASKQCMECHQVPRGTLLGAFSYELTRAAPLDPAHGPTSQAK